MTGRATGLILAVAAMLLAACGFEPMYGARTGSLATAEELSMVELAPILDRERQPYRLGLQMQNALSARLYPSGVASPRYRLEVVVDRELQGFGFRSDEAVTRYGLRLIASYRLIDLATDQVALAETARVYNSFDVAQSDFATQMAERDMEERLTRELSERIASRLSLHFRDKAEDAGAAAADARTAPAP